MKTQNSEQTSIGSLKNNVKRLTFLTILLALIIILYVAVAMHYNTTGFMLWGFPIIFLYQVYDLRKKIIKVNTGLRLKENYTEEQMDEFRKDVANVPSLIAVVVLFLSIISLYTAYLIIDPFEVYQINVK
jgi:nitrate reductase NapE component